MERLENLTDPSLCLQDLVSSTGSDHHNVALQHASPASFHHPVHDGSAGLHQGMLGHHHVHHHDSHHHHHHTAVPCPPSLLHHEPLEKLKRGTYILYIIHTYIYVPMFTCESCLEIKKFLEDHIILENIHLEWYLGEKHVINNIIIEIKRCI